MKICIEYESDTLLPRRLHELFGDMKEKVKDHRNEPDKMEVHMSRFRLDLIMWIDDNSRRVE